jgi:hypothetical protein
VYHLAVFLVDTCGGIFTNRKPDQVSGLMVEESRFDPPCGQKLFLSTYGPDLLWSPLNYLYNSNC